MFQAHGESLSVGQVIVIVIVATLAAIGTASIPHGGLVTLITALQVLPQSLFLMPSKKQCHAQYLISCEDVLITVPQFGEISLHANTGFKC